MIISNRYKKQAIKFIKARPNVLGLYKKKLKLLEMDPFHPSLRIHKLQGKYNEYYSISINMQHRLMIDFIIQNDCVILIDIGDHNGLYR